MITPISSACKSYISGLITHPSQPIQVAAASSIGAFLAFLSISEAKNQHSTYSSIWCKDGVISPLITLTKEISAAYLVVKLTGFSPSFKETMITVCMAKTISTALNILLFSDLDIPYFLIYSVLVLDYTFHFSTTFLSIANIASHFYTFFTNDCTFSMGAFYAAIGFAGSYFGHAASTKDEQLKLTSFLSKGIFCSLALRCADYTLRSYATKPFFPSPPIFIPAR